MLPLYFPIFFSLPFPRSCLSLSVSVCLCPFKTVFSNNVPNTSTEIQIASQKQRVYSRILKQNIHQLDDSNINSNFFLFFFSLIQTKVSKATLLIRNEKVCGVPRGAIRRSKRTLVGTPREIAGASAEHFVYPACPTSYV